MGRPYEHVSDQSEQWLDPQQTSVKRVYSDIFRMQQKEVQSVEILLVSPPRPNLYLSSKQQKKQVTNLSTTWMQRIRPLLTLRKRADHRTKAILVLQQHPPILTYQDGVEHKSMIHYLSTL
eukprot:scaffold171354_cov77-Attheya_sp.AAC.3